MSKGNRASTLNGLSPFSLKLHIADIHVCVSDYGYLPISFVKSSAIEKPFATDYLTFGMRQMNGFKQKYSGFLLESVVQKL